MKKLLTIPLCMLGLLVGLNTTAIAQCTGAGAGIPDDDPTGLSISCVVTDVVNITDVTLDLDLTHTWVGDLIITITDPLAVVTAAVVNRPGTTTGGAGCSANDMNVTLTDVGTDGDIETACSGAGNNNPAYVADGTYTTSAFDGTDIGAAFDGLAGIAQDKNPAGLFKGMNSRGTWTVNISDNGFGDTGTVVAAPVLTVTGTPLPVELTTFDVTLDGDAAQLTWQTASETDNAGFEIETMLEGSAEGFRTVGYVEGNGTTNVPQSYGFQVADLGYGTHLFRLKQIDLDGTFAYSWGVEATRELATSYALDRFYPNPFNPQGSFRLMVAKDQAVNINVYNIMGQMVGTLHEGMLSGQEWHAFTFQAGNNLPSGTYLIRATGETFANTQKIMLVK